MRNPHQVTIDFEKAIAEYTGAPYAVAVSSCTMALLLAVAWHLRDNVPMKKVKRILDMGERRDDGDGWGVVEMLDEAIKPVTVEIPKRTYVSVPMSIIHAGGRPAFRDEDWVGWYQLKPLPVWDSARYFSQNMYSGVMHDLRGIRALRSMEGQMVCVSFHAAKTLGIEQGGAILLDDPKADMWLRRARFDGRVEGVAPKDQKNWQIGFHCYLNPSTAAQGLLKLHSLPRHNAPLPNDDYPDLSTMGIFK